MFTLYGVPGPRLVEPYSGGGQGGPGLVTPYHDDGVPPGPGEEEEEEYYNHLIKRRVLVFEELVMRVQRRDNPGKLVGKGEKSGYGQ